MKMTSTAMMNISFGIEGAAISERARHHVLSKDWRGGLRVLLAADEDAITMDIAMGILEGRYDMIGNSDQQNLCVVEAKPDSQEIASYLETLSFQTAGLYQVGDKVYQPEFRIGFLAEHDFNELSPKAEQLEWYDEDFLKARILFYANETKFATFPRQIENQLRIDFRSAVRPQDMAIIWKQVSDFPLWVTPHECPYKAIEEYLARRTLQETGAYSEVLDWKHDEPEKYQKFLLDPRSKLTYDELQEKYQLEDDLYAKAFEELKAEILEQAGPQDGEGWFRLPIYKMRDDSIDSNVVDRYLLVPKLPFYKWSLSNINSVKLGIHDEWKPCSHSGIKQANDDPNHTDWVIGAGLDPKAFSTAHIDVDRSAFQYRVDVVARLAKFDFVPLSKSDMTYVSGKVRLLKPGEQLEKGQIGVIPHAGVEYEAALLSAATHKSALICATGGKLAHLAVVGRELNVPVILWEKAMCLTQFDTVSLNLTSGRITVQVL
jgi:phosphohistidine swiveling domain-containing protein